MSPNNAITSPEAEAVEEQSPIAQRQTNEYHWNYLFQEPQEAQLAFKPTLGQKCYACYSCRSLFGLKYSFQMHMNRRVVFLKYFCTRCNENLLFYNRCTFLHHCRQHFGLYEGEIHLDKLYRRLLSDQLVGITRHPNLAYVFDEEECAVEDNEIINPQFYSPLAEDKGKTIVRLKPTHLLINKIHNDGQLFTFSLKQISKNIPKCVLISQQELSELWARLLSRQEQHVEPKVEPVDQPEMVTFTDVSYPSLNEVSCLNEIITSGSSDVSSEGMWTVPVITKIETVEEFPQDENKRCSECNFLFADLAQHFLGTNRPTDENLRCVTCKLISPTICALKAHLRTHEKLAPFVCPDCGSLFLEYDELLLHLENVCFHTFKSVRFRCPGRCGKLFASTKTFSFHFKTTHIETYFLCSSCNNAIFKTTKDCEEHLESHDSGTAYVIKRFACHLQDCASVGEMDGYNIKIHLETHVKDLERCIYIYTCKLCRCYYRSVQTMSAHIINCRLKKRRRRQSHEEEPNYKECVTCKKKMMNSKYPQCVKCTSIINPEKECICILCKERIHYKDRRIHQMTCKYSKPQILVEKMNLTPAPDSGESDSEQIAPQKKQKVDVDLTVNDNSYRCSLCEMRYDDQIAFHRHLKNHRSVQKFQCMDCGECFLLRHSLMKHLLHVHRVTNYEQYFASNDCYDENYIAVNNGGN